MLIINSACARNERLVSYFDTEAGPVIQVMVGAVNVSAIDTVWQEKRSEEHTSELQSH